MPHWGTSNDYPHDSFSWREKKYQFFWTEKNPQNHLIKSYALSMQGIFITIFGHSRVYTVNRKEASQHVQVHSWPVFLPFIYGETQCVLCLSPLYFINGLFHLRIWTCPLPQIGVSMKKNQNQNSKQCRSWWDVSLWAVSSGSTLFAQVPVLVCREDSVNASHAGKMSDPIFRKKIRRNVIGWNCLASTKENLFHCRSCWEEFQTWCRR